MSPEEIKKEKFWAGAILFNPKTRSMLMQKRDAKALVNPNQWALFGGVGESGETPLDCAIREIQEELGITLKRNDLLSLHDYLIERLATWRFVFSVAFFLTKEEMTLGEGAGFDWVPVDKVLSYDMADATKRDIEFFLQKYEKAI